MDKPGMRQAKTILGDLNWKWYNETSNLNWNDRRMLTGFITKKCRVRRHLNELPVDKIRVCRFCSERQKTPTFN